MIGRILPISHDGLLLTCVRGEGLKGDGQWTADIGCAERDARAVDT